jgi:hypothetical protein
MRRERPPVEKSRALKCPKCGRGVERRGASYRCTQCLAIWRVQDFAEATYDCGCRLVYGRQVVRCDSHPDGHPLSPLRKARKPDAGGGTP